jgi:hypothetical protein
VNLRTFEYWLIIAFFQALVGLGTIGAVCGIHAVVTAVETSVLADPPAEAPPRPVPPAIHPRPAREGVPVALGRTQGGT